MPTNLPIPPWANPETYVPPIGTPLWDQWVAEQRGLYEDWKQRHDRGKRHVRVAQLAIGGAAGGAAALGGGAAPGVGGFVPGATSVGGLGANIAQMGLRAGVGGLLKKGLDGSGGGGDMPVGTGAPGSLLEQIAAEMFAGVTPLRDALIQRSMGHLNGGVNSPAFAAVKANAEPQFNQARDQVIADTAPGGALTAALAKLQTDKARMLTGARGAIDERELGLATNLVTGGTGAGISGLGAAGSIGAQNNSIQAQIAQSEAAREAAILGALGTGAGAYFGQKD